MDTELSDLLSKYDGAIVYQISQTSYYSTDSWGGGKFRTHINNFLLYSDERRGKYHNTSNELKKIDNNESGEKIVIVLRPTIINVGATEIHGIAFTMTSQIK